MPPPPADLELDRRLRELEEKLDRILTKAREHPIGRKILAYLGLT